MTPLFSLLKKEGKLQSNLAGDAIAEEDYQDNQRGQASPDTLQNKKSRESSHVALKQPSREKTPLKVAPEPSYDEDEFEGGTDRE